MLKCGVISVVIDTLWSAFFGLSVDAPMFGSFATMLCFNFGFIPTASRSGGHKSIKKAYFNVSKAKKVLVYRKFTLSHSTVALL